jgi:short-chain Z-isoprenyl diphosphate synthase
VRLVGNLDHLPPDVAARLRAAASPSSEGLLVNIAVGYGGREEIADAVRALLRERVAEGATLAEVAESLSVDDIDRHVYTSGQPAPDLLIRASGEQRLGGFLLWQSVYSELYFCETYWPAFRRIDFLRALRDFSFRERRLGK